MTGDPARDYRRRAYDPPMRSMPTILLILSLPVGAVAYVVSANVLAALPLPEGLGNFLVLFAPLLIAGLVMLPFLIPWFDRRAKADLAAYRSQTAAAQASGDAPAGEAPPRDGDPRRPERTRASQRQQPVHRERTGTQHGDVPVARSGHNSDDSQFRRASPRESGPPPSSPPGPRGGSRMSVTSNPHGVTNARSSSISPPGRRHPPRPRHDSDRHRSSAAQSAGVSCSGQSAAA